jgi:subtilisin family serine protease
LLIHASGNDSKNNDKEPSFPSVKSEDNEVLTNNWIEVGASYMKKNKTLAASFSNYGSATVDIFAPGVNVISTKEDNSYDMGDGTSFASPMVAGAAALIKSYYPSLSAKEIKDILLSSAIDLGDLQVMQPGSSKKDKKLVLFSSLSTTGGVLNIYNALVMAEQISNN